MRPSNILSTLTYHEARREVTGTPDRGVYVHSYPVFRSSGLTYRALVL